ncbi:maleylpyruvate isomerase family mycothiol-dependent enzyme [Actinomadura algeriensis]|uniref:Maleylpyruvate isomerase n=1 Tax=Actinomadura algeriensis TaxID=1679523 RepID=A0ABR9K1P4_9ACTN|nr:maleylpyruvate isomerase family mycothiol-dependent enzyme [Actinomadura algeriensis]MBE1536504.1 maleylpyruvate isomerase [Actinomadura algeriensis]
MSTSEFSREVIDDLDSGTERIVATLAALDDADLRAPSALPGWSRAHVATHIARNADSLCNMLEWARTGEEIPQYPSIEKRNADIEAGAGRSRDELVEDVRASAARFGELARALPEDARDFTVRAMASYHHPAWYTILRRWHEVEAHHVDLAAGYGPADWPDRYVGWAVSSTLTDAAALPREQLLGLAGYRITVTDLGGSAVLGEASGAEASGTGRAVLGWLSGRSDGAGVTVRPDGPPPEVPPWPHAPAGFPAA